VGGGALRRGGLPSEPRFGRMTLQPQVIGHKHQPFQDEDDEYDEDLNPLTGTMTKQEVEDYEDLSRMTMELTRMTTTRDMKIPLEPAPPVDPPIKVQMIPADLLMPPKETMLARMLMSSCGRSLTFALSLLLFGAAAAGLVLWPMPDLEKMGLSYLVLAGACVSMVALFAFMPKLAKKSGIATNMDGADWKPYFVFYRVSFLAAIPALICLSAGYGQRIGFGSRDGDRRSLSVVDLEKATLKYFEVYDGFVALNLTKGVTETRSYTEHGYMASIRYSRYRDAELKINTEPFSGIPEPTKQPGALRLFRIAPIFETWNPCVDRYQISISCLRQNNIAGWAISITDSMCTKMSFVACSSPEPVLEPMYKCSDDKIKGTEVRGQIEGLCGRVMQPPKSAVVDELRALLTMDGWPVGYLPAVDHLWVDVAPNECYGDPEGCIGTWDAIGGVGAAFAALTCICISGAMCCDCFIDERIRSARKVWLENEKRKPENMI